jgi:signal transduction histidine kinase
VPDELNSISLSMDVRRNIFLICKEAINNLVKYSSGTTASIIFSFNHSILTMLVNDNGNGFQTDRNTTRNGLKNMKRRAAQIGGELAVDSEINKGTSITLSIKIS